MFEDNGNGVERRLNLVKAECTNCGGILEIDVNAEMALCPYCNASYFVKKESNQYNNAYSISSNQERLCAETKKNVIEKKTFVRRLKEIEKKKREDIEKHVHEIKLTERVWNILFNEIANRMNSPVSGALEGVCVHEYEDDEFIECTMNEIESKIKPGRYDKFFSVSGFASDDYCFPAVWEEELKNRLIQEGFHVRNVEAIKIYRYDSKSGVLTEIKWIKTNRFSYGMYVNVSW